MIRPFRWLWEQLNGPQISALRDAIWSFFVDRYDGWLEYWYHLSIATANDAHLTLMGNLRGLARPLVRMRDANYALFAENPPTYYIDAQGKGHGEEHNDPHGFDAGVFYDLANVHGTIMQLPAIYYRIMLTALYKSGGETNSLDLLDALMWEIATRDVKHGAQSFLYHMQFHGTSDTNGVPSDIDIYVGGQATWTNAPALTAMIEAANKTLFGPAPVIHLVYKSA